MQVDNSSRYCTFYILNRKCTNENCKFKHDLNPNLEYKIRTVLCKYYSAGFCNRGSACTFAHGEGNLVIPRQPRIISHPRTIELPYLESGITEPVIPSPHEWLTPTNPIELDTSQNGTIQQSDIDYAMPQGDIDYAMPQGDITHAIPQGDITHAIPQGDIDYAIQQGDIDYAIPQGDIIHESETSNKFINSAEIIDYKYTIDKIIKKQNESDLKIKILELEVNTLKEMMKYKELQFQEITNDLLKQIELLTQ